MPVPLISLVARTSETAHVPFPVATDQLRQLKLDNIGPLDGVVRAFGFAPRPMNGHLGYLRRGGADRSPPARPIGVAPEALVVLGADPGGPGSSSVIPIALGSAGLVTGLDHRPGTPLRPELTWQGDPAIKPGLMRSSTDLIRSRPTSIALAAQARIAIAALVAPRSGGARSRDHERPALVTRSRPRRPTCALACAACPASQRPTRRRSEPPMSSVAGARLTRRPGDDGRHAEAWAGCRSAAAVSQLSTS